MDLAQKIFQANKSSTKYHLVKVAIEKEDWQVLETVTTTFHCFLSHHVHWQTTGAGVAGFLEAVSKANNFLKPKVMILTLT